MSLLLLSFIFASFFSLEVDAARSLAPKSNLGLIKSICEDSQDYDFCMTVLAKNPRTRPEMGNKSLLKLAIGSIILQAQTTVQKIPAILTNTTDPLDRKRLAICHSDYEGAVAEYQRAYNTSLGERAYNDVVDSVDKGSDKVGDCEVIHAKEESVSPLMGDNLKVYKLWEIILLIVTPLVQNKN